LSVNSKVISATAGSYSRCWGSTTSVDVVVVVAADPASSPHEPINSTGATTVSMTMLSNAFRVRGVGVMAPLTAQRRPRFPRRYVVAGPPLYETVTSNADHIAYSTSKR